MAEKRRLPVIQNATAPREPSSQDDGSGDDPGAGGDDGPDEARPEWQWIGFGVVAMFASWLPFAAAAGMIARNLAERVIGAPLDEADAQARVAGLDPSAQRQLMAAYMTPHVVALALAGGFAGFVIGKFGQGGGRAASVAAAIVCIVAGVIAVRDLSSFVALLVVLVVAVLSARAGARIGARRRKPDA